MVVAQAQYFIKYYDVIGIEHRLNIYYEDPTKTTTPTQIDGRITLSYADADNPLEPIRGQGLRIELEASSSLTFNDLWSDNEKTRRVDYKRDNVLMFQGWLNPEGFFEDYVNSDWIVSLDCVDGLGYLSDLSFVETDGLPFTGKHTFISIISKALIRTGLELNINTDVNIRYTGLSTSLDIYDQVKIDVKRYYKDDGETIMDCEAVLKSVLEPFGACITSRKGEWYIYKPNQLFLNQTASFVKYNYKGIVVPSSPESLNTAITIGSDWEASSIFHCSGNQRLSNKRSIGSYRIHYKYGLVKSLLENYTLYSYDGITIDEWTIIDATHMYALAADTSGISYLIGEATGFYGSFISKAIPISGDITVDIEFTYNKDIPVTVTSTNHTTRMYAQVIISDKSDFNDASATKMYLTSSDMSWSTAARYIIDETSDLDRVLTITPQPIPDDYNSTPGFPDGGAYLFVYVYTPKFYWTGGVLVFPVIDFNFESIKISPSSTVGSSAIKKGEFHTFQRLASPSSYVPDVKVVEAGDNFAEFYEGALYENNGSDATTEWNREGISETKALLRIMGEETMRMSQSPARVFSGDVYGFYDYLSVISIDNFSGYFMPISYVYDTKNNIITAILIQIYGSEVTELDSTGAYELTYDYGNTVKPTII